MAVDVDTASEVTDEAKDYRAGEQRDESSSFRGADEREHSEQERQPWRQLFIAALVFVIALAGLTGWLGYRSHQAHQAEQRHELFLQTARQGALNLTTISHTEVDANVQRILDSATGSFFDDFQQRSKPFVEVVRQAQSTSVGDVTAAGVEDETADSARVLVAATVKTSTAAGADEQPRSWRMRITVQRVDDGAKVANVEFVP